MGSGGGRRAGAALLGSLLASALLSTAPTGAVRGPEIEIETLRLDNGMTLLLAPRPESTTLAAGWMVRAGSADDPDDRAGLAHLLEHLMFKGTETIGARDPERERILLAEEDRLREERRTLRAGGEPSGRRGRRLAEIERRLAEVEGQARATTFLGELSLLYHEAGGVGLNAHTLRDLTLYYVTLPAERLETWFWLESDRLAAPVFRELEKEKRVIAEERRMRVESTPTGLLDEELTARFWGPHPYARPPLGSADSLERIERRDARDFFARHYRPGNITAALVGGFDPERAADLARRYFGRLPVSPAATSSPAPPPPAGERRWSAECRCPTQVQVLYPTLPFVHPDAATLDLVAGLLGGRSGRLHRALVLEQGVAFSVSTLHSPLLREGYLSLSAESLGDRSAEELLAALDREVERLRREPPEPAEIDRVRNRLAADAFRRLKDPADLLRQLLVDQGLGDWRQIELWPRRLAEIGPEDLTAAAATFLARSRRLVATYRRAPEAPGEGAGAAP